MTRMMLRASWVGQTLPSPRVPHPRDLVALRTGNSSSVVVRAGNSEDVAIFWEKHDGSPRRFTRGLKVAGAPRAPVN